MFSSDILIQISPYLWLTAGAFVVLALGLFVQNEKKPLFVLITCMFLLLSILSMFCIGDPVYIMNGLLLHDKFGCWFAVLLLVSLFVVVMMIPYQTKLVAEYPSAVLSLLLMSACGGLFMIFSNHLVVFFVGLELLSIPLYVLVGLGHHKGKSSEASFKYFLLGAVAAAVFIYGTALIWSSTSSMRIDELFEIFRSPLYQTLPKTFWFGLSLVVVSLLFKLGVFPFHFWIPDVYEAAPASINAWMSTASKIAVVGVLIRLFYMFPVLDSFEPEHVTSKWMITMGVFSIFSMMWGSIGGLYQKDFKRLLGYSTISHMGYVLMFISSTFGKSYDETFEVLFFYLCIYVIANLVMFLLISQSEEKQDVTVDNCKGLVTSHPVIALGFAFGLLSLAGLPPFAGFVAKFKLFYFVIGQGGIYLVIFAILSSIISVVYYFRILANMFLEDGHTTFQVQQEGRRIWLILFLAFLLILFGILPQIVQNWLF